MRPKYIFDLSEVLISGLVGIEIPLALIINSSKDEILRSFGGHLLEDICCGKISEDVYLEKIILEQEWKVSAEILKTIIRKNFHHEIKGTKECLRQLAQKYEVVLLSDHAKEWVAYIHTIHPFLEDFEWAFFSYEFGRTKKNPEIFQIVLEKMSWRAEDCWLIDDNSQNVETAATVGINGIHFQNAKQLNVELRKEAENG